MRRGWVQRAAGWIALIPILLLILVHRSGGADLLRDSDTAFLLMKVRERHAPLSWFAGDWPLENHFYRPVATLFFELDNALYRDRAWGYGLTNALLVVAGVIALYALLRRFFSTLGAWTGATLFALWVLEMAPSIDLLGTAAILTAIGLGVRAKRGVEGVLVALGIWALLVEWDGIESLAGTTLAWLPGRTATACGLFAILALASYAASVQFGAEPREPGAVLPTDPPATRNTVVAESRPALARWLFAGSLFATFLSLASYEQGVVVPALIFGTGLLLAPRFRVRFGAQSLHWGVLVGYLILRAQLVPVAPSGYQRQVIRFGPGVAISLGDYVSPRLGEVTQGYVSLTSGIEALLVPSAWIALLNLMSILALWIVVDRRSRRTMMIWLGMSLVAFLPMAFVKHFGHYHYLPMAIRTGFLLSAVGGLAGAFRRVATPRSLPAPPRSRPAPGSLPHL